MAKTVEEKYKSMSQIEHILKRSGMYIGSVKEEVKQQFVYDRDEAKMVMRDVSYTPGLLKLIDEVISNSCDEYRRKGNLGLDTIDVTVHRSGHFIIKDNGGIPVVMHKDAGCYVPQFIFGQLRTSSNYDDDEERDVIGTNGIGSKVANIFSNTFIVDTSDGKNSFHRSWSNNMQTLNDDLFVDKGKEHFSKFTFDIDFTRFEDVDDVTDDFATIIEKRCIDAAASNIGLTVNYKFIDDNNTETNSAWNFTNFEEYIELYADYIDASNVIKFSDKQKSVWIYPDGGMNIGFVNGAECSKGTHIKAVRSEINNAISSQILSKNKIDVGARNIDGKYTMFCNFHIANPSYDSQTKDTLTTPVERFSLDTNYKFSVPSSFIKECCKSEIVNLVLDWYKQKTEAEDQKTIRRLNKQAQQKIRNSDKFIDANSKKVEERELWLFEVFSAADGFRAGRNPQTQAAYMLRGKCLNVCGLGPTKIMANQELSDIITILGLQWGEEIDTKKLNFGKIVIASDQDYDGFAISGLLMNFFNLFPQLFDDGLICRSVSPIIIARKGSDTKKYFRMEDYKKAESGLKGYKITYIKGLGSLQGEDFKEMLQRPTFHYFTKDDLTDWSLKAWFAKEHVSDRKNILKHDVE